MIRKLNKSGQTALILILLAAAALIFFAITLNWGHVAQTKSLLTISADQSAALMGSDAASYGEQEKQTYLKDQNSTWGWGGVLISLLGFILAIVCLLIPIPGLTLVGAWLLVIAAAMATVNLVLQLVVIQPGMTSLWNKAQANLPIQEQFFEQGISTALQGAVGDQVNVADYFDSNTNGQFGIGANNLPNDVIGRFALYYSDRLKMLNQPDIPQVVFFYNQLGNLINGSSTETCTQNASDNALDPAIPINPACPNDCTPVPPNKFPTDPNCQKEVTISNNSGFQLSDACTANSDPTSTGYNPYCDPCCQQTVVDPLYNPAVPNPLHPSQYISKRPSTCPADVTAECQTNNPYGPNYTYLYDPTYQSYSKQKSFLDLFGRDRQMPLPASPPLAAEPPFYRLLMQGDFPNGIYPFFWLMKDFSPEIDNINPGTVSQEHWCDASVTPPYVAPVGFPTLAQLRVPGCVGQDCCVYTLGTTGYVIDTVGSTFATTPVSNPALDPSFGEQNPVPSPPTTWLEGDDQFCSASPGATTGQCADGTSCALGSECTDSSGNDEGGCVYGSYNGISTGYPDGSCEWTGNITMTPLPNPVPGASVTSADALDDTMHILSGFVKYSNALLSENVDTLSSNFSTWYPQVADWTDPVTGRLANIYSPGGADRLGSWNTVITNWLKKDNSNANVNAWCVPAQDTLVFNNQPLLNNCPGGNCPTNENNYIAANSDAWAWDDVSHVVSCLNYNSGQLGNVGPIYYYTQCLNDLKKYPPNSPDGQHSSTCTLPASCSFFYLGRALTGAAAPSFTPGSVTPTGDVPPTCGDGGATCAASSCTSNNSCPSTPVGTAVSVDTVVTENCSTSTCNACNIWYNCGPLDPKTCVNGYRVYNTCGPCSITNVPCSGVPTKTATTVYSGDCNPNLAGSFANWVQNNLTLVQQEAPKFALREQYLNDIYTRAKSMQNIFGLGDAALQSFLGAGGPAAQLATASKTPPTTTPPNSVIYGWIDKLPNGGSGGCSDPATHKRVGCAHIVKVTVVSPGMGGSATCTAANSCDAKDYDCIQNACPPSSGKAAGSQFIWPFLPKISTDSGWFTRTYELVARDGYVYAKVARWDEDHSNAVAFPNGHALWQFTSHNPTAAAGSSNFGGGSIDKCAGLNGGTIGFGLEAGTVGGLIDPSAKLLPTDLKAFGQAFMLNDEGDGKVDANAITTGSTYSACLTEVNALLATAPESHACVEYIAGPNADKTSGNTDYDYTLKFVQCPASVPDDLPAQ